MCLKSTWNMNQRIIDFVVFSSRKEEIKQETSGKYEPLNISWIIDQKLID